jgi:hypothetical protein
MAAQDRLTITSEMSIVVLPTPKVYLSAVNVVKAKASEAFQKVSFKRESKSIYQPALAGAGQLCVRALPNSRGIYMSID